jgi:hypothetical protein
VVGRLTWSDTGGVIATIARAARWLMPFVAALIISASIVYVATASAMSAPIAPSEPAIAGAPDGRDDPVYMYAVFNDRIPQTPGDGLVPHVR